MSFLGLGLGLVKVCFVVGFVFGFFVCFVVVCLLDFRTN